MINLNEYAVVQCGDDKMALRGRWGKPVFTELTKRDWAMVRELLCPVCANELTEPKRNSKLLFCHSCKLLFTLWKGKSYA